jgi:hypothetical protein
MKSEDVMTAIVPASRVPPGYCGFRQAARMEWIKLRTLRSVKWALLVALATFAEPPGRVSGTMSLWTPAAW